MCLKFDPFFFIVLPTPLLSLSIYLYLPLSPSLSLSVSLSCLLSHKNFIITAVVYHRKPSTMCT